MIQYNPKDWIALIFHNYSRYMMRALFPMLLFMSTYTLILVVVIVDVFHFEYESTIVVHSILGIVLGLFLVFRTNSAYDRWWEGRKKWGELVNNSRALAQKINAFLPADDYGDRAFFGCMISNFVYATKEHLRKNFVLEEMQDPGNGILDKIKSSDHKPNVISSFLYHRLNSMLNNGLITPEQLLLLDKELKAFVDIVGACERIKNTPIPYSYNMFIKKFIFTFVLTLPLGIAAEFHYWTVPIVFLLFYILVSIELIAEEIEDPFGRDVNDLPTDSLADRIRTNVNEILSVEYRSELAKI